MSMSWLGSIFGGGISETASAIGSAAKDIEDVFTTSDREKLGQYQAETQRMEVQQRTDMGQIAVNREEARHHSIFVAGWRPWCGWVCGIAMAYHFIFFPLFGAWVAQLGYPLIDLNWQELSVVLMGMLGFGTLRSYEKAKGIATGKLKKGN